MRYIATLLASAAIPALAYFSLVFALIPAPISAEYWVREMVVVKRHIARQYVGQRKIIVSSGSNSLFGIDTALLTRELGVPAINLGLHASMSLDSILGEAELAAESGDLVVLPLEPPYYCKEGITEWQLRNAVAWDADQWRRMALADRVSGIAAMGPFFPIEMAKARMDKNSRPQSIEKRLAALDDAAIIDRFAQDRAPTQFAYSAYALDALGNMRKAEGTESFPLRRSANDDTRICPDSWGKLDSFVKRMGAQGIRVVIANTPYVRTDQIDDDRVRDADRRFSNRLSQLAQVIDSRTQLVFPRDYFFNTDLHLNTTGRAARTGLLADALRACCADQFRQ